MGGLFFQNLPFGELAQGAVPEVFSAYKGIIVGVVVAFLLATLILYVYLSIAYSRIGKRAGLSSYDVAWMPMGIIAIIFEVSKMHWWPFLVFMAGYVSGYFLILLGAVGTSFIASILGIVVLIIAGVVICIMNIVWHWKTYEAVGRPGWWILILPLFALIGFLVFLMAPLIGFILIILGVLIHLVMVGLAAWGRSNIVAGKSKRFMDKERF